jgi:uncharacterized protein YjbI with pentapeptide repeats
MLHKANLFGAMLHKSTLTEANHRGASFIGANLTKASSAGQTSAELK